MSHIAKFNCIDDINFLREINSKKMEDITFFSDARKSLDNAFAFACYWGHYDVARWLLLVKPDIETDFNYLFQISCEHGYIDLAKFLLSKRPEQIVINIHDNYAYRNAKKNGHKEVCEWLDSLNI